MHLPRIFPLSYSDAGRKVPEVVDKYVPLVPRAETRCDGKRVFGSREAIATGRQQGAFALALERAVGREWPAAWFRGTYAHGVA